MITTRSAPLNPFECTSRIRKKQIEKAVKALLMHLQKEKSNNLLESPGEFLYTTFTLENLPTFKVNVIKLKHSIQATENVLLIVKDSSKKEIKNLLQEYSEITVVSVGKLIKKTKSFQEKRNLLKEYSTFIVDDALVNLLPKILGKKFYDKKKLPIPISITSNLIQEIKNVVENSTLLVQKGICVSVKVGNTELSCQENVENVIAGIEGVIHRVKGKWDNVQSIHLKAKESVALPIYQKELK